jgi:hypothetical protein
LRHLWHLRETPDFGILQAKFTLQEVQHALALDYGLGNWKDLKTWVVAMANSAGVDTETSPEAFSELRDLRKLSTRGMDRLVRELDYMTLVRALHDELEEVRDLFFGSMSVRAAERVKESLAREGPFGPASRSAQVEVLETANRLHTDHWIRTKQEEEAMDTDKSAADTAKGKDVTRADLDRMLTDSPSSAWTSEQLIDFFKKTMAVARTGGLIILDGMSEKMDDEFLKTGTSLVVDGTDVEVVRSILEARKKTLIADYERRLDMTITALEALSYGDHPHIIEAKCRAFLPS